MPHILFKYLIFVSGNIEVFNNFLIIIIFTDNRTYHFQAEDEPDLRGWLSVLVNCKEGALYRAFDNEGGRAPGSSSLLDLQQAIIRHVQRLPSNDRCCDCNSVNGECSFNSDSFFPLKIVNRV